MLPKLSYHNPQINLKYTINATFYFMPPVFFLHCNTSTWGVRKASKISVNLIKAYIHSPATRTSRWIFIAIKRCNWREKKKTTYTTVHFHARFYTREIVRKFTIYFKESSRLSRVALQQLQSVSGDDNTALSTRRSLSCRVASWETGETHRLYAPSLWRATWWGFITYLFP